MMVDCDENMIVHLLRNWHPNRLQPQGVRLASLRPALLKRQNNICPVCQKELKNDGNDTHVDHFVTVKDFLAKVLHSELTFDDAYRQLWADSNLRAICRLCNYGRRKEY
jgi:5-methylcytosine-specific restriction endonuclease McrA